MIKKEMIDLVLDGHETDIQNWVLRDPGSLRVWLKEILGLNGMTKDQIKEQFGVYLPEDEEDL